MGRQHSAVSLSGSGHGGAVADRAVSASGDGPVISVWAPSAMAYAKVESVSGLSDLLAAWDLQARTVAQLRAPQLALQSPCLGWTVRDVLNHSLGVTAKLTEFASGLTDVPHAPPGDLLGADPALAVRTAAQRGRRAWTHADMTRRCHLPFGTFSAEATIGLNLFDVLAHTWDVTTAAGWRRKPATTICGWPRSPQPEK